MAFSISSIVLVHQEPSASFAGILDDYAGTRSVPRISQELARRAATYVDDLGGGSQRGILFYQKSDFVPGSGSITFLGLSSSAQFKVNTAIFTGRTGSLALLDSSFFRIASTDAATAQNAAAAINATLSASASSEVFATYAPGATSVTVYALWPGPRSSAIILSGSGNGQILVQNGFGSGTEALSAGTYPTVTQHRFQYDGNDPSSAS
jgi:hypothetical protein